jgi:hypothetical protein
MNCGARRIVVTLHAAKPKHEAARLAAEAERVRQFELPGVIAEPDLLIERYQLTEAMIFGATHDGGPGKSRTVMAPKHVDQVTGDQRLRNRCCMG